MNVLRHTTKALAALMVLIALLVGIPVLLVVVGGWPLPTQMPNWDNVYWAARQGNIPSEFVIKTLACVVWLAWAQLAWAVIWEIAVNTPAAIAGRRRRRTPLAFSPMSQMARHLVSSLLVISTLSAATSAGAAAAPPLHSLTSSTGANDTATPAAMVHTDIPGDVTAAAPDAAAQTSPGYRVSAGDTLWGIAEQCLDDGGRVDEIIACNPHLSTTHRLRPGQVLELPSYARLPVPATAAETASSTRIVESGDTLWDIVDDHYGEVDAEVVRTVAQANDLDDPSLIFAGQEITLPILDTTAQPPAVAGVRAVTAGDTLWDIVDGHYGNVDGDLVWAVAAVNQLENPSLIFPGQQITLPPRDTLATPPTIGEASADDTTGTPSPAADADASGDEFDDAGEVAADTEPATEDSTVPAPTGTTVVPAPGGRSDTGQIPPPPPSTVGEGATDATTVPAEHSNTTSTKPVDRSTPTTRPAEPAASDDGAWTAPVWQQPDQPDAAAAADGPLSSAAAQQRSEFASARWLFGGGVAVTSLALVGAWMTLRRLRRRRRRWLNLPRPTSDTVRSERGSPTALGVVDELASLIDAQRPLGIGARAAIVTNDELEVLVEDDAALSPPSGWTATSTGWTRPRGATSPVGVLSPAVVSVGTTDDGDEVVIDLATAGSVSVTGDRAAVEHLVCSMAWELASDPLDVDRIDVVVVGLTCVSAHEAAHPADLVPLTEAINLANTEGSNDATVQVFLIDPFEEPSLGRLGELVSACAPGRGRCVVIAGPCEQPGAEIQVPTTTRVLWEAFTMTPPQLPADVDVQLAATLAAATVGRRHLVTALSPERSPDPEADAIALRSVALLDHDADADELDETGSSDHEPGRDQPPRHQGEAPGSSRDPAALRSDPAGPAPVAAAPPPAVWLRTTGREIEIVGIDEPIPAAVQAVTFLLAAADRPMHVNEVAELTGYTIKSLSNRITSTNPLIERNTGTLQLREPLTTDHQWATDCVRNLAAAIEADNTSERDEWMLAGFAALAAIERAPYAVLPVSDQGHRPGGPLQAWGWVDEFPTGTPTRARAEADISEAALAYTELWTSIDTDLIGPAEVVGVLCHLAAIVPYAAITRTIRPSRWASGAECLLEAATRTAGNNPALKTRVQRAARDMVARQHLDASDDLADALDL